MQDEQFVAAERILLDIDSVFKKDPKLKEFDIVPVTLNQNKSPVIHVDHCLGLESWCVRHVYCYVYHHIMDIRQICVRHRREDPAKLSRWLLGALLINPDVATFWNMRRELVQSGRLDFRAEMHLTAIILSRKPKSGEAFAYRKWVTGKFLLQNGVDTDLILDQELSISQDSASRYPNNYHAWSHRTWCLIEISPQTSNPLKALLNEWFVSEEWIKSHVSDHSGLQFRQFLQKQLFKHIVTPVSNNLTIVFQGKELVERSLTSLNLYIALDESIYDSKIIKNSEPKSKHELNFCRKGIFLPVINVLGIIAYELHLNVDLILRFSGHEALWCHRRFLLTSVMEILSLQSCNFTTLHETEQCYDGCTEDNKKHSLLGNIHLPFQKNWGSLGGEGKSSSSRNMRNHSHMSKDGIPLEKDQKLSGSAAEIDIDQTCHLFSKALSWHEHKLVEKCGIGEPYQQRLATQHRNWLGHILRLGIPKLNSGSSSLCT